MSDNEPQIQREVELTVGKWKVFNWKMSRTDEGYISRVFGFISTAPKKFIPFICVLACFVYFALKAMNEKAPADIFIPTISFLFIVLIASLWFPFRAPKK